MSILTSLPNIGKVSEALLLKIGIDTPEKLKNIGSKEAFTKIRLFDTGACLHMLYGLEGAIEGIPDKELSENVKKDLKAFYKSL